MRRGLSLTERLWQYIDVGKFDECWPWTAGKRKGYGRFTIGKRSVPAHRLAYETFWRTSLVNDCLHRCNNPPCCNPLHLYDGTNSDNQRDAVVAGTSRLLRPFNRARGESNGLAKLTGEAVREIRDRYAAGSVSQQQLADEYGVAQSKISALIRRKTWAHIT